MECVKSGLQNFLVEITYLLDDASQSGRSGEVYCNQIETLIENNQYSTMWEIADVLNTSKSVKLLVKM